MLLDKILMCNISKCDNELTMHLLSDLEAYCNRQILLIREIAEEALGAERKSINAMTVENINV